MDVFFLGAGESFSGTLPSALKAISKNRKALDWQLQSLERAEVSKINFMGGFHVQEIIEHYPHLNYTIAPDWRNSNIIHTLLQAPFRAAHDSLVLYSDTLFRPKTIEKFSSLDADVLVGIDSQWRTRFEQRSDMDISTSEVLRLSDFLINSEVDEVEFTGLLKLSNSAIEHLNQIDPVQITNLMALIKFYHESGLEVKFYDVLGDWTEFNSDLDIAHFILGTKSETLYRLYPLVKESIIGEQVVFTVQQWRDDASKQLSKIQQRFNEQSLVVRSSSYAEDCWDESHAGGFESVLNVDSSNVTAITNAVEAVINSYKGSSSLKEDQVLVQECLSDVKMSGVVFTRSLETGSPYYRINFDDQTQSTESVTSGAGSQLRTVVVNKEYSDKFEQLSPDLTRVLKGVIEIEELLAYDKLDIEFAIDTKDQLHVFQVRPIAVSHKQSSVDDNEFKLTLDDCVSAFRAEQAKAPNRVGAVSYFGVMPDWNPAEIIGVKPKSLAYSLYRYLIVDEVWAIQRAEFGYRDVSQYPLIRTFAGQPYVNIRNSFNSFIPASVSTEAAERICNAYLLILKENPQFHDKIEFDVAFTVLSPEFDQVAARRFEGSGVLKADVVELKNGLRNITQHAFGRLSDDIADLYMLEAGRKQIHESNLSNVSKALLLLSECKKYGTLAFSHAARAGFVAMTFLNSLVKMKVLDQVDKELFLSSFNTVAGDFENDAQEVAHGKMSKQAYIEAYGHLRPGTYDITAKAYWENPQQYLLSKLSSQHDQNSGKSKFKLSEQKKKSINSTLLNLGLELTAEQMFDYCRKATQARELVKFEFSKNLSKALDHLSDFGKEHGIKRKQMAYLSLADLREYELGLNNVFDLKKIIKSNKKKFTLTKMIELPQLILTESDFYGFERNASEPNYVTSKSVEAACVCLSNESEKLTGKIVFIEQADPGYDWMFAYDLAGLITMYGGANSHMAIRSAELNLPAAIGVGDKIYDELKSASIIRLNCAQKQIIRIK